MQSEIPRGRQARSVWRSLSPQARAAAFAASSHGAAPADIEVAWAAAGYGWLVWRRLRIASRLVYAGLIIMALAIGAVVGIATPSGTATFATLAVFAAGAVSALVPLGRSTRRFQRLYSSGLLGVEASRLALPGSEAPAMWTADSTESEFTVPYHAQLPLAHPAPSVVADPVSTGVHEISIHRRQVVVSLSFRTAINVFCWLVVADLLSNPRWATPALVALIAVPSLVTTLHLIFKLYEVAPVLLRPVAVRFTPDGWEIPPLRVNGAWAELRSIRMRSVAGQGVVALIVDNPERLIAHLGPLRRRLARSTITEYGSPAVISASAPGMLSTVDLVRQLRRYTNAPVDQA